MINKLKLSKETLEFCNAQLDKLAVSDKLAAQDELSAGEIDELPLKIRNLINKIENEIKISNKLLNK